MELRPRTSGYGNTDHWTKLKVRTYSFRDVQSADVSKRFSLSEFDRDASNRNGPCHDRHANVPNTSQLPPLNSSSPLDTKFNVFIDQHLSIVVPKSGIQKHWLNNCYQRRAREGFRYWLINRPLPTSYAKYGLGSYKMVMGLGMAPRT